MLGEKREATQRVTRELVLTAARTIFKAKGYEGATIRDIALAAGRSTGSIFANWKGKEELFEAAMERKAPNVVIRDMLQQVVLHGGDLRMAGPAVCGLLLGDLYGDEACISA